MSAEDLPVDVQGPNFIDRIAMGLSREHPMDGRNITLPLSIAAGVGAGLGFRSWVDGSFTTNHQYEAQMQHVDGLESTQTKLQIAEGIMSKDGRHSAAQAIAQQVGSYSSEVAQAKAALPSGYEPHLEGVADGASFLLGGVLWEQLYTRQCNILPREAVLGSLSRHQQDSD